MGESNLRQLKTTRIWMVRIYEVELNITFAISMLASSYESSGILFYSICCS